MLGGAETENSGIKTWFFHQDTQELWYQKKREDQWGTVKSRERSTRSYERVGPWGLVNTLPEEGLSSIPLVKLSSHLSHRKRKVLLSEWNQISKNQLSKLKVYRRIHRPSYQTFFIASEQKTQRLIKCCPCPQLVFIEYLLRKWFACFWFSVRETTLFQTIRHSKKNAVFYEKLHSVFWTPVSRLGGGVAIARASRLRFACVDPGTIRQTHPQTHGPLACK